MAKGEPPYADCHPMRVLFLIPKNNPPQLDGPFSKSFKEFVTFCLMKNPEERPTAKELLRHRFVKSARKNSHLVDLIERFQRWKDAQAFDESDDETVKKYIFIYSMSLFESLILFNHPMNVLNVRKTIKADAESLRWDFGTVRDPSTSSPQPQKVEEPVVRAPKQSPKFPRSSSSESPTSSPQTVRGRKLEKRYCVVFYLFAAHFNLLSF
jgi:serine/threonine protein kinase